MKSLAANNIQTYSPYPQPKPGLVTLTLALT